MDIKKLSVIIISGLLGVLPVSSGMAQNVLEPESRCVGGEPDAPLKIEVFSCYQCPPCRTFYLETMRPLLKDYASINKVCVVYYEFPLEIHDYSREAARYGEAARHMGQEVWQRVSEALFQHLEKWRFENNIESVVSEVLSQQEMVKIKELIKDPSVDQAIDRDLIEGNNRKLSGTPTFYIHAQGKTEKIVGTVSFPVLKNHMDRLLR